MELLLQMAASSTSLCLLHAVAVCDWPRVHRAFVSQESKEVTFLADKADGLLLLGRILRTGFGVAVTSE